MLLEKQFPSLHREPHLRPDSDQSHIEVVVLGLNEYVRTLKCALARGVLGVLGQTLPGEGDDTRCLGGLDGGDVGASHFFGVAGTDVENVGHSAVEGSHGDGLMRRSVLTDPDAVVSGDVDLLEALKRGHAHSGGSVQMEDKVCGCHGDEGAFVEGSESVGDGAHGVLTDTVVDVSTAVVSI